MRRSILLASFLSAVLPFAVHAATVGDLVKIPSSSAVYYIGSDQARHAFPTEKIFHTWYADFSNVKTVTDADLAAYTLGANVFYRPGVRMVKITTDPKVYAVDHNGTLKWVSTEAMAQQLYGASWNTMIDDLSDAFFSGYRIGTAIAQSADFFPAIATANNATISANQFTASTTTTVTPPPVTTTTTPVTTYDLFLTTSNDQPHAGTIVDLFATVSPQNGLSNIAITVNGAVTNCGYTPCVSTFQVPRSGTLAVYPVTALATWMDGHQTSTTANITINTSTSGDVTTAVTHPEIEPNKTVELVASVNSNFTARFLDIYVDGNDVHGCDSVQECRYVFSEAAPVGTVHTVYSIARDANGVSIRSDSRTYSVVADDHPEVSVILGKTFLYKNETFDVTINANDQAGVAWTEIWVDGTMVKHCSSLTCTGSVGPWTTSRVVYVVGKAQDISGLQNQATSSAVIVQ